MRKTISGNTDGAASVRKTSGAGVQKKQLMRNALLISSLLTAPVVMADDEVPPMRVISVLPFRWNEKDIDQLCRECEEMGKTGVTHFAFSATMEPESSEKPYEKADAICAQFRKIRAGIKGKQKVGYLLQSTLAHGGRSEGVKGYTEFISVKGENTHRFCPLNKNLQKYLEEMTRRLCRTKPDFLLVDDDFRMVLSGRIGCFCPDHLKKFAALTGKKYTREELLEILDRSDPESKRLGDLYVKMDMESLWECAAAIRRGIDSVDPEIECGFCTSSEGEFIYAAQTARILAGKTKPFVRLNNSFYFEDGKLSFPYRQMNTAIEHHYISVRDGVETISECDTYPQNRYSLSLTGMHMHICSSMLTGCCGRKMWIENFRMNVPEIPETYLALLRKTWKQYEALNGVRQEFPWRGAVVPLPKDPPTFMNPLKIAKIIGRGDFIADALGNMGIAASYEDDGKSIILLAGEFVAFFSDEELKALLKRNVILDVSAAGQLIERGFAEEIGIRKVGTLPAGLMEKITDPEFVKFCRENLLSFSRSRAGRLWPEKDARILTKLVKLPFKSGPPEKATEYCPGAVFYRNSKGGRIITLSYPVTREVWARNVNLNHHGRKNYYLGLLEILDPSRAPAWVETDLSCYLMYGCSQTGDRFHAAVFNMSLDPMTEVKLHVKRDVKKVSVLQGNGKYVPVKFRKEGDAVTVENPGNEVPLILLGEFE